jgi:hypothetical protein
MADAAGDGSALFRISVFLPPMATFHITESGVANS